MFAQKAGQQAVFAECSKVNQPGICTHKKMENDITALITQDIIKELEKSGRKYFSISLLFITDENGKVITSETEIRCENNDQLKLAIQNYVDNLPAFIPKDIKQAERRSVHIANLTYIQDTDTQSYHLGNDAELKAKGYAPDYINLDAPAAYKNCPEGTFADMQKCLETDVRNAVMKAIYPPPIQGVERMKVYMLIDNDGKLIVEKIAGGSIACQESVMAAVKKVRQLTPAMKNGIPVPTYLMLPIVIQR